MLVVFEDHAPMTRKSKWIEVESPDEPAVAVAQRALRARLRTVWHWLSLASSEPEKDVENVHQLRVATRRAMAAVEIFSAMEPGKRSRWFTKQLKRARQAAGDARDFDVLMQRLSAVCDAEGLPGCDELIGRVRAARRDAQQPICAIHEKLVSRNFNRRLRKLVRKTRWRSADTEAPSFLGAAQSGLRPLATTFFSAGEADLQDTQSLHEFRIAAKQLRYAIEVFAGAFGPAVRKEIYPLVEELQEKLGEINDHATARDRLLSLLDDTPDESQRLILGKLVASETAALQSATRQFREWWTAPRAAELKTRFWREVAPSELRCA